MESRRLWFGILVSVIAVGGLALGVLAGPDVTCLCTKMSDSSLEVTVQSELVFYRFYEYYFSDSHLTDRTYEEYVMVHTFTDVSVASFPLTVWVFLYLDEYSYDYDTYTEQAIDCAHLFAPEIDILADGSSIASGSTHDLGTRIVGTVQTAYTIDNSAGVGALIVGDVTESALVNCSGFQVDTPLPLTVDYGDTATLYVSFQIDDPGAFGMDISIVNNDLDEHPYDIEIVGEGQTPEQVALGGATQQLVPLGGGGEEAFLDQKLPLDEAGDPVMAGYLPLAGVYEVGALITGQAMVCDPAMNPLHSSWIHMYIYSVDLTSRPEQLSLIDHWMVRYDHELECYILEWSTEEMPVGVYDIYLSIGGGQGETIRIQLVEPEA